MSAIPSQASSAIPRSDDANFHSASLTVAHEWQLAVNHWPASKAFSFSTLLAATVDGVCDAAERDPKFLEAAACEFVQDAHLLMGGRKWHMDQILKNAVPLSVHRIEKSCAAMCDAFTSTNKNEPSPAVPSRVDVELISSIFLTARSVPQADVSWPSVRSCICSWCLTLLCSFQTQSAPRDVFDSCFLVLSLIADSVRARLCLEFLTDPSCVELVCVCCELQPQLTRLRHISIELLDIILSYSSPSECALDCCAVPVIGCGTTCSLVWQPLCPFSLPLVQPHSSMLVTLLVSMLQPQLLDAAAPRILIPQVTVLNCLRCLNTFFWFDESARSTVLSSMELLSVALTTCSTCPQAKVRHAAAFLRCTLLLRCSNVDFTDSDGLSSSIRQRHLLHLFPELVRLRSSSRPQSSSRLRPLSASPPVVASADMIVFSVDESQQKVVDMRGLLRAALDAVFHLPVCLSECGELSCALLDTATLICISSDSNRVKLAQIGACSECSLWQVLLRAIESPLPAVRVSALQLTASLRHNSVCLGVMSASSSLISALRRSVQRLSHEGTSNWNTKAAACACSVLHSIVTSAPAVCSSLLYGRRHGRAHVPVESAHFDAACLQRVHWEEDEASDDDDACDAANLGDASQIFDVENELSDVNFAPNAEHSMMRQSSPSLNSHGSQSHFLTGSTQLASSVCQPRRKTFCVGANGLRRQQRFIAGLQQAILSGNFSCRSSAVMLAAELAAVFVCDGLPALAATSASSCEQNDSRVTVTSVFETVTIFPSSSRIAVLLTESRCIESAATLLREPSPCMHLMACKYMSRSIKAGAALEMRVQLLISRNLIYAMDAALLRVLDANPIIDPLQPSANAPGSSSPLTASTFMTKIKSSEKQSASLFHEIAPTFSPLQVAAPADACVWPVASSQLTAVAILDEIMRAFTEVLDACDAGAASHFAQQDWTLLTTNIRLLVQRGKYYDLPQFKHKNVQSDATTAAALYLLAACVRARCNYITIIEDSSFLEAIFGIMNNPGATGPNAALRAVLEISKVPDAQRALSSTFGFMTGTKAGSTWKNSAMSKMSREIKRLCASGGSPPAKSSSKTQAKQQSRSFQNDDEEDEDFETGDLIASSPLLPPISPSRSSRVATGSPLSRITTASKAGSSPSHRSPALASSTPPPKSRGGASQGGKSPAAAVLLPALR